LKPLVSIIVLSFNSQDYIGRALKSLQLQTYPSIEVVVVDNGSTDNTKSIVKSFDFATWLSLPCSDMGMARNYGVMNSNGEYLMFLDSDDFYLADKIESQVSTMSSRPELNVLFSPAYIYRTGQTDLLGIKSNTCQVLSKIDFISGFCYTLATICIRRSIWGDELAFEEGELGRYGEDWRFQLNLVIKGERFDVLDLPAVVVEIRKGSHTSWEIQPKMKALALATIEGLLNSSIDPIFKTDIVQTIVDDYRFKLAVSLVLVGRVDDALIAQRAIRASKKALSIRFLIFFTNVLPANWIQTALEFFWICKQNSTFRWSQPSKHISKQIANLTH